MENAVRQGHPFTPEELRRLESLDSSEFGCLNLTHPDNQADCRLVAKALKFYEQKWWGFQPSMAQQELSSESRDSRLQYEVALKLGHLNLLIHNFVKALSAYQFCFECKADAWKDPAFLYGLGLVYFHFNVHKCAMEVFEKLLYTHPNFSKSSEVHVRAGLCAKALQSWDLALKHLKMANADTSSSIFSRAEVLFHIAHCLELKGDFDKAHAEYRALLSLGDSLSPLLRSSLHRQLGWLIFRDESCGDKPTRVQAAISELQRSLHLDRLSGKSHYYLGRCLSSINRAQEAFVSYRDSIDKNEANPETWCSIGVLYHQQRQPFDALQAYACAIELNPSLVSAWVDLGLLYEQHGQFRDCLECYKQAYKHKSGVDNTLLERIEFLESQMKGQLGINDQSRKPLPGVESISSLPIPAQLMERQRAMHKDRIELYLRSSLKISPSELPEEKRVPYLSPHQLQVMHMLQQNSANLNPQQVLNLRQLQETYSLMLQQGKTSCPRADVDSTGGRNDSTSGDAMASAELANTSDLSLHTSPLTELPQVTQEDLQAFLGITDQEDLISCLNDQDGRQKDASAASNYEIPRPLNLMAPLNVPLTISGEEILSMCRQRLTGRCKPVYEDCIAPPEMPEACPKLPKDKLLLPTPTIVVDSKKDATQPELQQFCYEHPIALIRGLTAALRLDLALFSTMALTEIATDGQVEVRTQVHYPSDKNFNKYGQLTWRLDSVRSFTTVGKYAAYQARTFRQAVREEHERNKANAKSNSKQTAGLRRRRDLQPFKEIKFGTNVDLSDGNLWKEQLKELNKLPAFCRVYASCNLLSHLGHAVLGMNTVQIYLKVPGCRTPGHQENNNFAGVNINVGPGECEWYAVPVAYWPAVKALCEKNDVDFLHGSWWPCLEELWESNIPIYRFVQKAGDVVWISEGTIHWVHSLGWCNNIAWNVGPLTAVQYSMAIERYEFNKLHSFKSIVPMAHLSWQLARNVRFSDQALHELIRKALIRSLAHCQMTLDYICEKLGKELKYHGREPGEPAHYCCLCEIEVFGILLVLQRTEKYLVYCLNCALKQDAGLKHFVALNEYHMKDLIAVYDSFTLVPKKRGMIC